MFICTVYICCWASSLSSLLGHKTSSTSHLMSHLSRHRGKNLLAWRTHPLQFSAVKPSQPAFTVSSKDSWLHDLTTSTSMLNKIPQLNWGRVLGGGEIHQYPMAGSKTIPDKNGVVKTDIVPNDHGIWQVRTRHSPFTLKDESIIKNPQEINNTAVF